MESLYWKVNIYSAFIWIFTIRENIVTYRSSFRNIYYLYIGSTNINQITLTSFFIPVLNLLSSAFWILAKRSVFDAILNFRHVSDNPEPSNQMPYIFIYQFKI